VLYTQSRLPERSPATTPRKIRNKVTKKLARDQCTAAETFLGAPPISPRQGLDSPITLHGGEGGGGKSPRCKVCTVPSLFKSWGGGYLPSFQPHQAAGMAQDEVNMQRGESNAVSVPHSPGSWQCQPGLLPPCEGVVAGWPARGTSSLACLQADKRLQDISSRRRAAYSPRVSSCCFFSVLAHNGAELSCLPASRQTIARRFKLQEGRSLYS